MSASLPGSRDLPASQYDLSTYWGRVRHAADISDPRTLLTGSTGLAHAKELVSAYKQGKIASMTPDLWKAKKVIDSTLHPDTGEPVFLPFRMSAYVLTNLVVTAGMLTPGLGTVGTLGWQITNQSLNVAINNANANKSTPLTTSQIATSYSMAVGASCGVALGLNAIVPRLKRVSPTTRTILSRLVPFAAVVSAGVVNVFLMRGEEIRRGIDVFPVLSEEEKEKAEKSGDESAQKSLGKSKTAAKLAVGETALSRVLNATPIMVVPPLVLVRLQRTEWLKQRPRMVTPVNLGLILTTSLVALPFALAIFPQRQAISAKSLEPEFWEKGGKDGMVEFNRGRRRFGALTVVIALFCLFASTASAASAVLGIDLGTSYLKGALVKPGIPLEIVLSKDSKRKEAAAVAFKTPRTPLPAAGPAFPERAYGGDALALSARFPGDVYPNLKPLLGQRTADGSVGATAQEYQKLHPALEVVGVEGRGTVGFKSPGFEAAAAPFSVEELLAMELQNLRENAETMAGKGARITDAVITVPPFYTAAEKRAVELAAELAGLKVLALVSDGVAVGLNYATSRTFPSVSEGGKPEHHMVFDMGSGSTTATVLRFQGRTVKDVGRFNKTVQEVQVLGTGWDKSLGGDALNELIIDDIIKQFAEKPEAKKIGVQVEDVRKHGRTMAKLWKDVEKVRQVLSANQQSGSSWEGLYQDVDFKYKITRTQFEELAAEHAARVEGPVKRALEAANLSFADLDSVILHGGAIRTPFVQKTLEGLAGDASKLRSNVNADEAAVFGAAFKGAGLSPSFRVKEIKDSDTANYAVNMRYQWNLKDRNQKLFTPTSRQGTIKEMPFKMLGDFEFSLSQQIDDETEQPILSVRTGNLTAVVTNLIDKEGCNREDINTKFSIKLDPVTGLPDIAKAEASCEVDDTEKKGGVVDGVKDFFGFGSKDGKQEPLSDGEAADETTETVQPETSSSASASSSSASEDAKSTEAAEPKVPKKKIVTSGIRFSVSREGFEKVSKEEMKRMKDRLAAFDASDKARFAREAALNELEAYTYRSRDLLEDEGFVAVSTDAERTEIQTKLSEVSEWLYGDGSDAEEKTLKAKHTELKALINPIVTRRDETRKRPEFVKKVKDALDQTESMIKLVKETIDKAAEASSSAAASSASAASSSSATAAEASGDASADPLADLEEESPSSSSAAEDAQPTEQPSFISPYTAEDLEELTKAYDEASKWLNEKLEEQDKLKETDDPVIKSKDLEKKAKDLNDVALELLQRKLRMPTQGKKSSGGKKSSSKKTKAKSKKDKKAEKEEKEKAAEEKTQEAETKESEEKKEEQTPEHGEL
ncbi:putative hsp70 family chaperone lhs1 protein [Neofusicoccum parvum UCRNP2]|uniref:Putative hsp70 family chaperone lhs1 protein n=1 Tax=Botryosphaeria parva (strain UCR-NP2) TaxID=1287680 RepID=R1GU18_BOTPV|nr:putative hsp70 family chaperone lhs1 protein [Neofusicoccum parvum UCRNP2]